MTKKNQYQLQMNEVSAINSLVSEIAHHYRTVEDEEFLTNVYLDSHELPRPIRAFLNDFKYDETGGGYCVVSGFPIDEEKIGPTPSHWTEKKGTTLEEEILLTLFGSLLGDVFAWSTQQAGYFVHYVMPIKAHENDQLGTGSKQPLWWHNEDAFHPYRGDYLGMMCLRNPDRVATTLACINNIEMDQEQIKKLFEPNYIIWPDESHLVKNKGARQGPLEGEAAEDKNALEASYEKIRSMSEQPNRLSVLFGSTESPYLRVDPYFMPAVAEPEAQAALDRLIRSIDVALEDLILAPGDFCFIDNYRTVHGRRPFQARHNGTDRWLARINITRDLRRSRSERASYGSRTIL